MNSLFGNPRFRTMRLEDGEEVIRLAGGGRKGSGWPSDKPHAGVWGGDRSYLLVPSGASTRRRVQRLLESSPALENRSGDAEVLVVGPMAGIARLLESGPPFCRARVRRPPSDATALAPFRFPPAAQEPL